MVSYSRTSSTTFSNLGLEFLTHVGNRGIALLTAMMPIYLMMLLTFGGSIAFSSIIASAGIIFDYVFGQTHCSGFYQGIAANWSSDVNTTAPNQTLFFSLWDSPIYETNLQTYQMCMGQGVILIVWYLLNLFFTIIFLAPFIIGSIILRPKTCTTFYGITVMIVLQLLSLIVPPAWGIAGNVFNPLNGLTCDPYNMPNWWTPLITKDCYVSGYTHILIMACVYVGFALIMCPISFVILKCTSDSDSSNETALELMESAQESS